MRTAPLSPLHSPALSPAGAPEDGQLIVGTSDGDELWGSDGDDTIRGLAGNDTLQGNLGDDRLIGGKGRDQIFDSGLGSDTLIGDAGSDELIVSREWYAPTADEAVLLDGGTGNDLLFLSGGLFSGSDFALSGTLDGGNGDDMIILGFVNHAVIDAGAGVDTVSAAIGPDTVVTLGEGADVLSLAGITIDSPDIVGLVVTDFETGDAGDRIEMRDMLSGIIPNWQQDNPFREGHLRLMQQGDDVMLQLDADGGGDTWRDIVLIQGHQTGDFTTFNLDGFAPDGSEPVGEVIDGGAGGDDLEGTVGGDTINGYGGDDRLYGYTGHDKLNGGVGNDYLEGGLGRDTLLGGDGDDYLIATAGDRAVGGKGDDFLASYDGTSGGTFFGGAGADSFRVQFSGEHNDAHLSGGKGDDSFSISGAGRIHLTAGDGDDQIYLENPGSKVDLQLGDGSDAIALWADLGQSAQIRIADFQAGDGGDRLDLAEFMRLNFNGWDNSTNPFAAGYLRLVQDGDATHLQHSANADGNWTDLFVFQGVTAGDLTAENLSGYAGDGSDPVGLMIHGTKDGEFLYGGIGPDTISAGRGSDEIRAGAGDDLAIGGAGDDALYGDTGRDHLIGGDGYDYLYDFDGGNTLEGGAGNDALEVHTFIPAADGLDVLDGGDGDDYILWSNNDSDAHALIKGGAGDDEIEITPGDSRVDVLLGDGADLVVFDGVSEYGGAVDIEDFAADDRLDLSNLAWWSADPFADGYMRLGQHGEDAVLQVYRPIDSGEIVWRNVVTFDGIAASSVTAKQLDTLHLGVIWQLGGSGHDELTATMGDTHLDGAGGGDVLTGSAKGDILIGGLGADLLTGGHGMDVFLYQSATDSTVDGRDVITDLSDGDIIDLSSVDALSLWYGDQSFVIVDHFTGAGGELLLNYKPASGVTLIMGDTDADGVADFEIEMRGDHRDFANFVL